MNEYSSTPEDLQTTPELTAREIMNGNVPAVHVDTSVADVIRTMVDFDSAGVAVVENGTIVGIVTESDVIARESEVDAPIAVPFLDALFLADAGRPYEEEIRRALALNAEMLMSAPVTSIRADATLHEIATVMIERNVHPMPVVDESNQYIGMVSRRDLVRVIAELESRVS